MSFIGDKTNKTLTTILVWLCYMLWPSRIDGAVGGGGAGVGGGCGVLTSDKVAFLLRAQFYGGPSFQKNCARGPQTHLHYTAKDLQMKLSLDI